MMNVLKIKISALGIFLCMACTLFCTACSDREKYIVLNRSSLNAETWLEVEKNETVKICIDSKVQVWNTTLDSIVLGESCLKVRVPTLIGVYPINVKFFDTDSSHKINLAVGMKYLNFKNEEVLLGYNKITGIYQKIEDPERLEVITGSYLVDKYPVTNCEFTQLMWDSIPEKSSYRHSGAKRKQEAWFSRKRTSIRNENCSVHDSAASAVFLYQAMKYANTRSVREGLKPYYIFSETKILESQILSKNKYIIGYYGFTPHKHHTIQVSIDSSSDGYRLPYYDEWMMLARGGDKEKKAPWGSPATPLNEIQKYARFESSYAMEETSDYISEPVGQLLPNGYGLYDMFGLAAEHVLLKDNRFIGNSDNPSVLKGGELSYGFYDVGASGVGAGFRLIRNIGNNAKWENVKN